MRKKSKLLPIIVFLLVLALGAAGYGAYYYYGESNTKDARIDELATIQSSNSKTAWIAISDISLGEELIPDVNVEIQQIYSGLADYLYWYPDSEAAYATTRIEAGTPIFHSMTINRAVVNGIRDYEVSVAALMTTQADYDFVDLRIAFADGSDYVVLSKKQIEDLSLENCIFTTELKEEEIQLMTSAILDAYLIKGTQLYVTRYTDPELQTASQVTYCPKEATINLLGSNNPNLTQTLTKAEQELNRLARASLADRLTALSEEDYDNAEAAWNDIEAKYTTQVQQLIDSLED